MATVFDVLEGAKGSRLRFSTDMELVLAVQAGLPARSVQRIATDLALPPGVVDSIVSRRTLERRVKENMSLTTEESDRLVRVVRIMVRAMETFGGRDAAMEWMNSPNRAMEGRTPLSIINTDPGVELIGTILGRIEHGVFS